jgi:hypothetical protein
VAGQSKTGQDRTGQGMTDNNKTEKENVLQSYPGSGTCTVYPEGNWILGTLL